MDGKDGTQVATGVMEDATAMKENLRDVIASQCQTVRTNVQSQTRRFVMG